ncbi:unnamed protein product [Candidula unifasciata]|uniref:Protein MIS12 homolog n=1 Tax=Candidula unifasciata TaxID=100452 RepID=A0A8S3YUK0_9EUPU|nr:unnamed protein product [Candidula unifasciata]
MEPELKGSSNSGPVTETETNNFEYEAQHFGFTPITLLNGMFNAVCDLYREALKAFCKTCSEKYPNVMSETEYKNARHAVSEFIDKDVCMLFDKLEYFLLHQVFTIPDDVVLPEDQCQLQRLSDAEETQLEKQIVDVRKRILAVKYANAELSQHLKDAEILQKTLDKVIEQLSSPENSVSQLGAKALKDWISYYGEMLNKCLGSKKKAT